MQSLSVQLSALCGLLLFLQMAWTQAPLERAFIQGVGTGLTVYLMVVVGLALVQRILAYTPPEPEEPPKKEKVEIDPAGGQPSAVEKTKRPRANPSKERALAPASRETAVAS